MRAFSSTTTTSAPWAAAASAAERAGGAATDHQHVAEVVGLGRALARGADIDTAEAGHHPEHALHMGNRRLLWKAL